MKANDYKELMNRVEVSDELREKLLNAAEADNSKDECVVNEPVEVIRRVPWYRRTGIVAAASLLIVAGIAGSAVALNTGRNDLTQGTDDMTYPVSDQTDNGKTNSAMFAPLAPVTDEWKQQVYFGSYYPKILYADEKQCIFTEGTSAVFVFDFEKGEIVHSANIKATFDDAGMTDLGSDGWNGVSMFVYYENDDEGKVENIGIGCSATKFTEGDSTVEYFAVNFDLGGLISAPSENFDNRTETSVGITDLSMIDGAIFSMKRFNDDSGIVYFEDSGYGHVEPGEGSSLPMLNLVLCTGENSETQRFWLFPELAVDNRPWLRSNLDNVDYIVPKVLPYAMGLIIRDTNEEKYEQTENFSVEHNVNGEWRSIEDELGVENIYSCFIDDWFDEERERNLEYYWTLPSAKPLEEGDYRIIIDCGTDDLIVPFTMNYRDMVEPYCKLMENFNAEHGTDYIFLNLYENDEMDLKPNYLVPAIYFSMMTDECFIEYMDKILEEDNSGMEKNSVVHIISRAYLEELLAKDKDELTFNEQGIMKNLFR